MPTLLTLFTGGELRAVDAQAAGKGVSRGFCKGGSPPIFAQSAVRVFCPSSCHPYRCLCPRSRRDWRRGSAWGFDRHSVGNTPLQNAAKRSRHVHSWIASYHVSAPRWRSQSSSMAISHTSRLLLQPIGAVFSAANSRRSCCASSLLTYGSLYHFWPSKITDWSICIWRPNCNIWLDVNAVTPSR
jgi:hypothetical protein